MDIRKYEILIEALDRGSFVKICEDRGYTQPGITHMMNSMEKEIGFPLLMRSNKGIRPTKEGLAVLPTIREMVKLNEKLEQQFHQILGVESGEVRVGVYPSIACAWLPQIIRRLRAEHPGIRVEVQEENSISRLQKNLREGLIDLYFASRQPGTSGDWIPIAQDSYLALLPEKHPLAQNDKVCAEDLMHETFFMCKSIDGLDPDIMRYFERQKISLKSSYSCNADLTIVYMVEQGLGVSMLPQLFLNMTMSPQHATVALRPVEPPVDRELGMAVRSLRELSPAMECFIRCARQELPGGKKETDSEKINPSL